MLTQIINNQKKREEENFPVASFLLPKAKRKAVIAFYNFVRLSDEIADHTDLPVKDKLDYLNQLEVLLKNPEIKSVDPYLNRVAKAILDQLALHNLKASYLYDLLHIFKKEITHQHPNQILIQSWDDLIHYCKYSANPVGRFLLDLFKENSNLYLQSDALCTLLQILNHIQDIEKDWKNNRRAYIPKNWWLDKHMPIHPILYLKMLEKIPILIEGVDDFSEQIKHPCFKREVKFIEQCALKLAKKLCSRPISPINIKLSKFELFVCFFKSIIMR